MDDSVNDQTRKTVSLTHRQLGISGGVVAAMLILNPVKAWLYTREEGAANSAQIAELKGLITTGFATQKAELYAHASDETHKHERMMDTMRGELKSEKDDRIREIEVVENLFKVKKTKTN